MHRITQFRLKSRRPQSAETSADAQSTASRITIAVDIQKAADGRYRSWQWVIYDDYWREIARDHGHLDLPLWDTSEREIRLEIAFRFAELKAQCWLVEHGFREDVLNRRTAA